jgi:hypothetical protein
VSATDTTATDSRVIPGVGRLDFHESEKRREYWLLPEGNTRRTRLPSVTGILRDTWPKPALLQWYARLGTDAKTALEEASLRGKAVHKFVETYCKTGDLLPFDTCPEAWHPYLQGAARFLWEFDPKPVAVERLVCHPEMRYAGRLDFIGYLADAPELLTLCDFKSNPKGAVYNEAHVQAVGYVIADERCGGEPIARTILVGLDEQGGVHPVVGNDHEARKVWASALDFYAQLKRLEKALA